MAFGFASLGRQGEGGGGGSARSLFRLVGLTVEARKLEHSFRRIRARTPYTLVYGLGVYSRCQKVGTWL